MTGGAAAGTDDAGRPGLIVVLAGPSGVGKEAVHTIVRRRLPEARLSVSLTTRPPRPYERDGVHYRFVDRATFERAMAAGELLEWTQYAGHLYGTPVAPVDAAVARGAVVILDFEIEGAFNVKAARPETLTIALLPPSMDELQRRLALRATEDAASLARRLAVVKEQLPHWDRFDLVIVNDDLERCADDVIAAIEAARTRLTAR